MKKTIQFLILIGIAFLFFTVKAYADEPSTKEYRIKESEDGYILEDVNLEYIFPQKFAGVNECFALMPDFERVYFENISSSIPIELPEGEYEISGSITASAPIVISKGSYVKADSLTLDFSSSAYLRIKGGSLEVISSSISGSGRLIKLDYSAESALRITSGVISGETSEALIDIQNGKAHISGGDIENKNGPAINSDSELVLSGSPIINGVIYDIILECPMSLGGIENEYYSLDELRINYLDTFENGTLTEILYNATARSISNILLFDENGKSISLTQFDTCPHSSEKMFAGVYLPHIVKFFINEKIVHEAKALAGEKIEKYIPENISGYTFDNWYRDREGVSPYAFDSGVYSSFDLYGIYDLRAPEFKISSLEFVYDEKDHALKFDSISHPLSGGSYTYSWRKNGEEISDLSEIKLRDVKDSGVYSCLVTFIYNGETASFYADNIKVLIKPMEIDIPKLPPVEYTGSPIYPNVAPSSYYSISPISAADVGIYTLGAALHDPENTKWMGTNDREIYLNFEITRAENVWVEELNCEDSYIGFPLSHSAVARFGEVIYLYSATENGSYTTDAPRSVGEYYVKAQVLESKNYFVLTSLPQKFSILEEEVVGIRLVSPPLKTDYLSFETVDKEGLSVTAIYNSTREEAISPDRLKIIYNNSESLRVGDTSVIVSYMGATLVLPVSVSALQYDLSSLVFENSVVTYDSLYHTPRSILPEIIGRDGIALEYEIVGGGSECGKYNVSLKFSSRSADYIVPSPIYATLEIVPMEVTLVWENTSFVYDGSSKLPTAYFTDAIGIKRTVNICGASVYASESCEATAKEYSSNYVYKNPKCIYTIAKADYDMSLAKWSASELEYTGESVEVILSNLPEGVTVSGYTDNQATNAGNYSATASLSYDDKNYNPPIIESHCWKITPAEYDLAGFKFLDSEYEYDGRIKYPKLEGSMPIGRDGIELNYSFSHGVTNVSDGETTVLISFTTDSTNYVCPESIIAKVKILPKGIYVLWTEDSFVYDGNTHVPNAESPESEIRVSGSGVNSGSYTASASSKDSNFYVINNTHSYRIEKAFNTWLREPAIHDFYESQTPTPIASAYFGNVLFKYYLDPNLMLEVYPNAPGVYYMVAFVSESQNYLPLESSPIMVTCLEVLPIDIRVEIKTDLIAFETLNENDFSLYLLHNDGSEIKIDEYISIVFENADSFRCADSSVSFSYGAFTKSVPVTVNPAKYDMSSVSWDRYKSQYNGEYQAPVLLGLPAGVEIIEYIGEAGKNAGIYTFSANVSYDAENYEKPEIPVCNFEISKIIVPLISPKSFEYNGKLISSEQIDDNDIYFPADDYSIKDSGEYVVIYRLEDEINYVFENGESTCKAVITVNPRTVNVSVDDYKLYLFENEITPSYTVSDNIIEGDELGLYYFIDGNKIYLKSSNPNYTLNVDFGILERLSYPNETVRGRILYVLIVVVLILCLTIFIYKKKDYIIDLYYMQKAKMKNKKCIGYVNNSRIKDSSGVNSITAIINIDTESLGKEESIIKKEKFISKESLSQVSTDEINEKIDSIMKEDEIFKQTIDGTEDIDTDPDILEKNIDDENYAKENEEDDLDCEDIINEPRVSIRMEEADEMLSDSMAKEMVKKDREIVYTDGKSKSIINVDTLSRNFYDDERVDVNILKQKSLVPYDTAYIKVLARGAIDKPLRVYANDFSISAVKMILLSGGEANRVTTVKNKDKK